jgi:signal transduction histidine kinase/CheY-like chemotaxis protein
MEKRRILVVDDEPGIGLLCKRLLAREGHAVTTMTDPRAAVKALATTIIDLLLVDIRMPVVDGFEVIAHTQRLQPEAAILIMTGHGTMETAIRALRQGVDGLILKPFDQGSELLESVNQAFADSRRKKDAARAQAIRSLFGVAETLFSETDQTRLVALITNAICDNLRCSHAGYLQQEEAALPLRLVSSRGMALSTADSEEPSDLIRRSELQPGGFLLDLHAHGDPELKALLAKLGLGSVALAPVRRARFRSVLYAARTRDEPELAESDLELLELLGQQAGVAIENAVLYTEQWEHLRQVRDSQKALIQAEKMATAGRLSASIAHEVNNPLQAVQNCLHLAGRPDVPAQKRGEYFELAKTELERLRLTVQRMLDFYRPVTDVADRIDLADLIRYVVALMSKQLAESAVSVELDLASDLPQVAGHGSQIQQVFINLVLNAADAMSAGGRLQVGAHPTMGGVEIMFTDTGPGIPADKQGNIFEPFFSTKDGGSGLGLTVSYNIVSAHGGTLELVPGAARGASFRVFLPTGGQP